MQIKEVTTWVSIYIIQYSTLFSYSHLLSRIYEVHTEVFQGMKKLLLEAEVSVRWFIKIAAMEGYR